MGLSAADKMEILELAARYNHAIDSGNGKAWAATFTEDGIFESGQGTTTGREALAAFGSGFPKMLPGGRHWTNNHVIDGDGDAATHTCYLDLINVKEGAKTITTAIYRDELKKVDGAWRFTKRQVVGDA